MILEIVAELRRRFIKRDGTVHGAGPQEPADLPWPAPALTEEEVPSRVGCANEEFSLFELRREIANAGFLPR